jgi:hypothetical protein
MATIAIINDATRYYYSSSITFNTAAFKDRKTDKR